MKNHNAVIIFARYPREGMVKTRLAKTLGENFALEFYKLCAEHTFSECKKLFASEAEGYLFFTQTKDKADIIKWTKSMFSTYEQKGKDLGEKMLNAFTTVFRNGAVKVVIIGTDLPDISSKIINDAFIALSHYDAVLGPTDDGGYYLLGLKNNYPYIFKNMNWSTPTVFQETLERFNSKKISTKILRKLSDIDTEEDLTKWAMINKDSMKSNSLLQFINNAAQIKK